MWWTAPLKWHTEMGDSRRGAGHRRGEHRSQSRRRGPSRLAQSIRTFANKDELIKHARGRRGTIRAPPPTEPPARHATPPTSSPPFWPPKRAARTRWPGAPAPYGLILFAARARRHRPELAKRLRARRALVTEIITVTNRATGRADLDPAWAGALLLALEDGFRLHRLIDPDMTPAESFLRAVGELRRLIGLLSEGGLGESG
jgi:hypothetical protein